MRRIQKRPLRDFGGLYELVYALQCKESRTAGARNRDHTHSAGHSRRSSMVDITKVTNRCLGRYLGVPEEL